MDEFLLSDLLLMQTAGHYELSEGAERHRSNRDLVDLFLTIQEKSQPAVSLEIGALQATFSIAIKKRLPTLRAVAFEANPYIFDHFSNMDEIKIAV